MLLPQEQNNNRETGAAATAATCVVFTTLHRVATGCVWIVVAQREGRRSIVLLDLPTLPSACTVSPWVSSNSSRRAARVAKCNCRPADCLSASRLQQKRCLPFSRTLQLRSSCCCSSSSSCCCCCVDDAVELCCSRCC